MTNRKHVTEKMIAANEANARKSTGPKTGAGKRWSRMNALKHGFFAKELNLSSEDRPEFEALRYSLLQQFAPATPMQWIAFEKIPCCCWRCKLSLRMESLAVALQQRSEHGAKVESAEGGTSSMEQWYGADYRSLQAGLRFLSELRADVAACGLLHLEQEGPMRESLIKGFGSTFYDRLMQWKGMSSTAIQFAEHMAAMRETFGGKLPPIDFSWRDHKYAAEERTGSKSPVVGGSQGASERPVTGRVTFPMTPPRIDPTPVAPEGSELPKVVPDPKLQWQMVVKLIDGEIEHVQMVLRTRGKDFGEAQQTLAEFSPRYFADACRDLERALDWYLKIKHQGL